MEKKLVDQVIYIGEQMEDVDCFRMFNETDI